MMQLLRRLAQEKDKTIFLSTHDFELALQVADTLWLMEKSQTDNGQPKLHIGTPQELASNGALARYVERPGITFDPQNLSVTVAK
jgi:iron complex transport system ATP-binding protein